ncbi:MAG TPA: hypothetical protein DCE41_33465 [Cytophagales bacterium]|nr:hypothetical protein [Cytophagales bacterium]HAP59386.1 hypothetical protein [Cytophagales bacterium]
MYWMEINTDKMRMKQVSAGSTGYLWGINLNNKIAFADGSLVFNEVEPLPNEEVPKYVSAATDGTVMAISEKGAVFRHNPYTGGWITLVKAYLTRLEVGGNSDVYGIGTGDRIYRYIGESSFYEGNDGGVWQDLSVGEDGTVICLGMDNKLYRLWYQYDRLRYHVIEHPAGVLFKAISVASDHNILAVTQDDQILNYVGENIFRENPKKIKTWTVDADHQVHWLIKPGLEGEIVCIDHDEDGCGHLVVKDQQGLHRLFKAVENPEAEYEQPRRRLPKNLKGGL